MTLVRRHKKLLLFSTCIVVVLPLLIYFCPGPIEGFWWSDRFACSDHYPGFWHFRDGEIIEYRAAPIAPEFVGTYRQTSWNRVEFNLGSTSNKTDTFVLHPGLFFTHFGKSEVNTNLGWWAGVTSYFYRVRDESKCQAILAAKKGMKVRGKPE